MTKLIPRSKIQQKINSLKEGGSIPKYLNAGILKKIYYWRSPDYSKTEDGKQQSFSDAYALARSNNDEDFWWTDDKGNRNIYNTDFKLTLPLRDAKTYKLIRYDYLKAIENPNSVGYNSDTNRWTTPKLRGFDPNLIGIGLDVRTNNAVRNYLKKTGRTKNPWLTLEEMEQLLNQSLLYFEDIFEKNTKGIKPSDTKRAITIGLLYHGHGPYIWKPNGPKTLRLHDALFKGTDQDFIDAVSNFYGSNSRAQRHSQFWNTNRKYLKGGPINKTLSKEEWDKDVSDQYVNRYPNLINKLGKYDINLFTGEPYIKGRLEHFTKGDSAVYTPILDRVETYLLNNDIATEQEKENAKIAGNMLSADLTFFSSRDRKEVSSGLKFLNGLLEKVTDDDIKKFANSDILHIGLLQGLELMPKGLSIKDMFKLKKYVSSDLFKEDHFGASKFGEWLRSGGTNSLDAWAYGNYGILE